MAFKLREDLGFNFGWDTDSPELFCGSSQTPQVNVKRILQFTIYVPSFIIRLYLGKY